VALAYMEELIERTGGRAPMDERKKNLRERGKDYEVECAIAAAAPLPVLVATMTANAEFEEVVATACVVLRNITGADDNAPTLGAAGAGCIPRLVAALTTHVYSEEVCAPACGALDGSPRTQELLIMKGYPNLAPLAPRLLLQDFAGGVWLSYELPAADGVRVRISTVTGDMAVLSAVAFDAA
jgi:hypothetical protein